MDMSIAALGLLVLELARDLEGNSPEFSGGKVCHS